MRQKAAAAGWSVLKGSRVSEQDKLRASEIRKFKHCVTQPAPHHLSPTATNAVKTALNPDNNRQEADVP